MAGSAKLADGLSDILRAAVGQWNVSCAQRISQRKTLLSWNRRNVDNQAGDAVGTYATGHKQRFVECRGTSRATFGIHVRAAIREEDDMTVLS